MSRVLKSDKLKTKKPNTQVLQSDAAINKKVVAKKPAGSRGLKTSTTLSESTPDDKERNKNKLSNAASNTLSKTKSGVHKLRVQPQESTPGYSQSNSKLVSRKVSSTSEQKYVSLRAKQLPTTSKVITATSQNNKKSPTTIVEKSPIYKKQNAVLDTPHNVTVCSPPPKKKNDYCKIGNIEDQKCDNSKLIRKGSRTLAADEIVVLKQGSVKMRSAESVQKANLQTESACKVTSSLKEPVAFEVKFEEKTAKEKAIVREKFNAIVAIDKNNEELNYSDDFDSYESDFETDSSTHSLTKSSDSSSSQSSNVSEILAEEEENCKLFEKVANQNGAFDQLTSDRAEHEDDSEIIQSPIREIQKDKERNLDSGHYDMNSRNINVIKSSDMSVLFTQPIADSLETFSLGTSEQMDSGISTCATSTPASHNKSTIEIIYGGYKDFYTKPIINARGSELMTKIQFDILSFTLVDLKPISYDIFMQTFGKLNTNQNFTQTDDNQMNVEQQTEVQETRSMWTQHPSKFNFEINKNLDKNGVYRQYCCGEIIDDYQPQVQSHCELEQSLDAIKQLNNERSKRDYQNYQRRQRSPINYEHLNSFLLRSSLLIDQILGSSSTNTTKKPIKNPEHENAQLLKRVCEKSFYMETNFLNTLRVLKIFSNNKYSLLITVHESLPDTNVYSSDFTNLLMVWCTNTCDKPLRLLTTWSQVSKVEISNDSSDIIVAALRDGSIALWDLRETYSFCSKLDGYLTHFAATQSIIPSWCEEKNNSKLLMDLGACLDVKSFRSQTNSVLIQTTFPKTQFVSLHDSGIVTVWTLVGTSQMTIDLLEAEKYEKPKCSSNFTHTFEYTSPWARVKLMQSTLVNIKEYLETKSHHSQSRFDKTKAFFQKNIYSDEALKELQQYTSEVGQQGIRFTSLECGSENLFICTNRNFILMCSKTLKMDKLKRIVINESQFLFPTALKVLSNEHFLAVGLSNGVVMILNCQAHKARQAYKITKTSTHVESVGTGLESTLDNNTITGKSCAIQNILLNVQKSCESMDFDRDYRPSTAACITLIESKKKPFELRILDQQVIMSGSVLRKNLIQSLELSSDGWYLFALANGHVRIYDFYLDREILYEEYQETDKIIGIATGKCGCRENNVMILRPNAEVEVHILNK